MQRRAEQVAQTRERIVDGALEVFSRRGARGTTMTEVARTADVSPATVTNHFATPELLLEAVVARLIADIRVPDASIFAGARSAAARVRVLTRAMFAFYERTQRWFDLLGREITDVPVLARAGAEFGHAMQRLYADALAVTSDDLLARSAAGLINPATYTALRAAGLSQDEATSVVADSLVHLAHRGTRKSGASRRRPSM